MVEPHQDTRTDERPELRAVAPAPEAVTPSPPADAETPPEEEDVAPAAAAASLQEAWSGPNYHISLWDTPVTYLCLPCNAGGMTVAEVESHVTSAHSLTPEPTPLAADYANPQSVVRMLRMEPTYRTETDEENRTRYICLLCAGTASEYWSPDEELMRQHQANRHGGQMIPTPESDVAEEDDTAEPESSAPPTAQEPSPEDEHAATPEASGATGRED
jgi:hypothetical protein